MTPLKQKISLIPFSIEHWCSPYKRRHFENRSDQTFCILLIKDVLSVLESVNLCRRQKFETKVLLIQIQLFGLITFRINLDPDVRGISIPKLWIHSLASFISPSLVQIGCWLHENWENREVLTNVGKWPIPQWRRKWKTGIHAQIRITTKSQPLLEGHL